MTARPAPSSGTDERRPGRVDVLGPLREPETELQRGIPEGARELVADPVDRGLLELDDEVAHVHARETRAHQAGEEREREGGEPEDLPPEELVDELRGRREELEETVEHRAQRRDGRDDEERREDPSRARSRPYELPDDQDDEERRDDAVRGDRERLLERVDDVRAAPDVEQALARRRVEVLEPPAPVVGEQDRKREGDRDRVRGLDQQPLQAVGHAPGRICERHVDDHREADLAHEEEEREGELVVAVAELAGKQEEARRRP